MKDTQYLCTHGKRLLTLTLTALMALTLGTGTSLPANAVDEDDEEDIYSLSPFEVSQGLSSVSGQLGATVGGQQDIAFFRDQVAMGRIPSPNSISPEGLFSEYDLPLNNRNQDKHLLRVEGEAMPARIIGLPEVEYLAQIGFSTGIDATTYQRPALNLAIVVDVSGSMNGKPLEMVKTSLIKTLTKLRPDDRISLVAFSNNAELLLGNLALQGNEDLIISQIESLHTIGGTNIEAGLAMGIDELLKSKEQFKGISRVLLMTDAQPNIGNTSPNSFMGLATDASLKGIGLTTLGVGINFGSDLAAAVSNVRGGNVYFFNDLERMEKFFDEDFSTMAVELAYDMILEIEPAPGMEICAVFGIPGDLLEWTEDGKGLVFAVETLFLSKNKGGIYLGMKPTHGTTPSGSLAKASLEYTLAGSNHDITSSMDFPLLEKSSASTGLLRGEYLVNEYTAIQLAAMSWEQYHDQQLADEYLEKLDALFAQCPDSEIAPEQQLLKELRDIINSYQQWEYDDFVNEDGKPAPRICGTWYCRNLNMMSDQYPVKLKILPNGTVWVYTCEEDGDHFLSEMDLNQEGRNLSFKGPGLTFNCEYNVVRERLVLRWSEDDTKQRSSFLQSTHLKLADNDELIDIDFDCLYGLPEFSMLED